jgi:hypothetical protein
MDAAGGAVGAVDQTLGKVHKFGFAPLRRSLGDATTTARSTATKTLRVPALTYS